MDKLFDNLKKGVSIAKNEAEKFTKVVIDKTTNIVDITKLNLSKSDAENKINKLYEQIGEIVYKEYANGIEFDGKIGDLCIEIDKFKAQTDEINEQIASLKNTVVCTDCGQYNEKSSEYCSKCGAKLNPEDTVTVTPDAVIDIVPKDEEE